MIRAKQASTAETFITGKRFENKFTRVFNGIGREVARELQPDVAQAFAEPGPVALPIEWTSDKQRKAFFASDGFGNGIPTLRTGKVARAWRIRWAGYRNVIGGAVTIENDVPYAKFVYGGMRRGNRFQQQFHKNTGWPNAIEASNRVLTKSEALTRRKFDEALRGFGTITTRGGA